MSEPVAFDDVKDTSVEKSSLLESETTRTLLIYILWGNESLNAESIVDLASRPRRFDQ